MSRRKLYRIIIEAGAAVLLIFVLVFFAVFRFNYCVRAGEARE